jgi:ribose transport system permease protein
MAMSVAWYLQLLSLGYSDQIAFGMVILGVIVIGSLNGFLVAYADVPPIFVTLASGSFVFGYVRSQLISSDAVSVPPEHWLEQLGQFRLASIPADIFIFALLCFAGFIFLRFTKWGRYVYFAGDNPVAARNVGIPVRPMLVLRYVISALISFIAGLLTAASLLSIQTRVVNSNLLYDVILVAVIGGIGLSGGKGGVRNVLIGAALIGIMLNVMTIANISLLFQNLIKSTILLAAIIIDGVLNPRDEQTAQQGDI